MKRIFWSILMMISVVTAVHASRAFSEPVTVQQPDGTMLTITLYGDEYMSWVTMTDGVLVMETGQGYCVAAINDKGELSATELLAHNPGLRGISEQQACQQQAQRHSLFFERAGHIQQDARRAQVRNAKYFPHTGSPRCLVILANFSNNHFSSENPVAQFEQYFNGETQENLGHHESKNVVGVRKYYEKSSQAKFTPQFDIVGPVTLPQTMEYYGGNTGGASTDANFSTFCKHAIAAVDSLVNFSDYDNSGDGKAELVCVIYAGYGESISGNPANTLWPKCGIQNISTQDGIVVSYMNCSPELFRPSNTTDINGIGLFCHEFSHGMGLPDLYPTNTSARINNQTPEFWDLMDYGEYANNGYAPVPYTAWEQEAMGWTEIEELTESRKGIELIPLVKGGKAYKFGNGANSEEWIIVENVQARDDNNKTPGFRYGHGLLAWHIAYASNSVNQSDYPNNTPNKPRVSIVPADGLVINGYQFGTGKPYTQAQYIASLEGDPFPGTSNVLMLTANQNLPNYKYYNGEATPKASLQNIREVGGIITFDYNSGTSATVKGDVNGDGEVGIGDIISVTNFMAVGEQSGITLEQADVNGDGEVGIGDIITIANIMAGDNM